MTRRASLRRAALTAVLCGALAACGGDEPPAPAGEGKRTVTGVVMKGAVQGATVNFYGISPDGTANPDALVATVTTDANGQFAAALPSSAAHLIAQTVDGSFVDESDPAPPASRRRITLPPAPATGFEAVLPPNTTSLAITPYSHAMLIKARAQAAGANFTNVFDAVRTQATTAFGFDPITTVPADPLSPSDTATEAALQYAILLGAAAQSINAIATTAGHLPEFADVMLFVSDLGDGSFSLVDFAAQVRRFRNNHFALYSGVPLPVLDEALLSQPAVVPSGAVLPLLTSAGELQLLDPTQAIGANNPLTIESGLSTAAFLSRTLQRADITAGVASNIRDSRLLYIKDDGATRTLWKVNLEPGQERTPVRISSIADACRINGMAEDFGNPENTILRIDTAGLDGLCGTSDDFTTAEAYLVSLATTSAQAGTPIGLGHCCGITGIGDGSGGLVGVLTTEDDGTGSSFFLRRRNVASLASPVAIATLDIAGTGQVYAHHARGLGDQHIYVRAKRSTDANYKLLRFNVGSNTLTSVFDFGTSDAATLLGDFDNATHDATSVYFTSADGTALHRVAHAATGEAAATLVSGSPGASILQVVPTPSRIVYEVGGSSGGVFSVPKAGGVSQPLGVNDGIPTFVRLAGTNGARVFIDRVSGTAGPTRVAYAVDDDGGNLGPDITDAHWVGGTFQTSCDFNLSCEDTVGAASLFLRRSASTTTALIELADPVTGAETGTYLGTIPGVQDGIKVFAAGFGRYAQITAIADVTAQTDLFLGDSALAAASPPPEALVTVAAAPASGDNFWLLFESKGDDAAFDADGDGLSNAQEAALGTDPFDADSDNDGLSDFDEVFVDGDPNTYQAGVDTDPTNPDTDGDGVGDGAEVGVGSSPLAPNTVRFVDPSAGCSPCDGLSWATAFASEADVSGANEVSGTGTGSEAYVLFAPGNYGPLNLTGVDREHAIYVGSLGPGVYLPAFPPTTVFSGGGSARALHVTQSVALAFANVRFENGFDPALGAGVLLEAPLHATFGANVLHLERVEITGNISAQSGGGVVASGAANTLTIEKATISGNQAQGSSGTVIQGGGLLALNGAQFTVLDSVVSGNSVTCATPSCTSLGGGGAASGSSALLDIQGSIVEGNTASTSSGTGAVGGGLSSDTAAALFLTATEVRNNSATGFASALAAGGGIAVVDATLSADGNVIRGNSSTAQLVSPPLGGGGGVYAETNATVTLLANIIADNKAAAGPGGGVNLLDTVSVLVQDNKFLSNGSLNPGGGLHVHPAASSTTSVFNNLFVGNAATDAAADGGAMELDAQAAGPTLAFESNTVAYNQTTSAAGAGGGVSVKASVTASLALNNNNIWFNQDNTPTSANAGDNYLAGGAPLSVAASGNNVNEASLTAGNLSPPANPLFVQGFYLAQATSPSVDAGDNAFAGPLVSPPYTTAPTGAADSVTPAVDIGFHHAGASAGSFDSVALTPSRSLSCASSDTIIFTPSFTGATQGEPGHLIVVELSGVTPALGSLTTLDPRGTGSRVARDLGDGRYAVTTSGFQFGSATGTFTIYADDQATPRTFTLTFTNAC